MNTREVEEASAIDEELCAVKECLNGKPWDQLAYKKYLPRSSELCSIGQLTLRGTRIVIPKKPRPRVLSLAHEGHLGIVGKQKLRSKMWWPRMAKDAEKHCKTCYGCQLVSRPSSLFKVQSVVILRYLPARSVTTPPTGLNLLQGVPLFTRFGETFDIRRHLKQYDMLCPQRNFDPNCLNTNCKIKRHLPGRCGLIKDSNSYVHTIRGQIRLQSSKPEKPKVSKGEQNTACISRLSSYTPVLLYNKQYISLTNMQLSRRTCAYEK